MLIHQASDMAYRMINKDREVTEIYGQSIKNMGSVDSGLYVTPVDAHGKQSGPEVVVPIEVKNIRDWIYPSSLELYQVLHKATMIVQGGLADNVLPVLVCRKAHHTLFVMAKALGFFVIEMGVQPLRWDSVPDFDRHVRELSRELRYNIIIESELPDGAHENHLIALTRDSHERAEQWRSHCIHRGFSSLIAELRKKTPHRDEYMAQLRTMSAEEFGGKGGW